MDNVRLRLELVNGVVSDCPSCGGDGRVRGECEDPAEMLYASSFYCTACGASFTLDELPGAAATLERLRQEHAERIARAPRNSLAAYWIRQAKRDNT